MGDQSRSLAAALKLTPEVESFIKGNTEPVKKVPRKTERMSVDTKILETTETIKQVKQPKRVGEARKAKSPQANIDPIFEARVAVTTRFRQATAEALRRRSLERKLRGERPWSQQEIIESAVNNWLKTEPKH